MDVINSLELPKIAYFTIGLLLAVLTIKIMVNLIRWGKKMPKGAFVFLAIFPILSIFPIPPQEIKKLERIKQEQLKTKEDNGDTFE